MNDDDRCPGTNRQGERCGHPAGWGTDHVGEGYCKHHGGASDGAPEGEENGNADHLGFSNALDEDLTGQEQDIITAFEAAATADSLDPVWARLAGEAYVRYRRSDDARHLAECRKCLSNASDEGGTVRLGDLEVVADFTDD
jgi:hypothetical protein